MLPPFNTKTRNYNMNKEELIEWMKQHGWTYGNDELVQKYVDFPSGGPLAGRITVDELVYIPKNFTCPSIKHTSNEYVFLTLMPTGVYLTCIHRNCRKTTGPIDRAKALRRGRGKEITVEEALEIEKQTKQQGLIGKIQDYADKQGMFID
jgi:hypothetical protein